MHFYESENQQNTAVKFGWRKRWQPVLNEAQTQRANTIHALAGWPHFCDTQHSLQLTEF